MSEYENVERAELVKAFNLLWDEYSGVDGDFAGMAFNEDVREWLVSVRKRLERHSVDSERERPYAPNRPRPTYYLNSPKE